MPTDQKDLITLERKFWQSMVDEQTDVALGLLTEPAFMVSTHGVMKFDHATYREMAEHGQQVVKRFELRDIDVTFINPDTAVLAYDVMQVIAPRQSSQETEQHMKDTSTWVRVDGQWRCAMHTESPAD